MRRSLVLIVAAAALVSCTSLSYGAAAGAAAQTRGCMTQTFKDGNSRPTEDGLVATWRWCWNSRGQITLAQNQTCRAVRTAPAKITKLACVKKPGYKAGTNKTTFIGTNTLSWTLGYKDVAINKTRQFQVFLLARTAWQQ